MGELNTSQVLIGSSPKRFICEIHREIYDLIEKKLVDGDKEKCLNLLAEAFWAGKKMSDRLNDFRAGWQKSEDWEVNPDFRSDLARRAERLNLLKNIKSVSIETIDHCNNKCDWCPNKDRETSPDNVINDTVFIRILRQLLDYNYEGAFHPFLRGEPTLDPKLIERIFLIRKNFQNNYIRLVTNGEKLTPGLAATLFKIGINSIHFNHYFDEHKGITKTRDATFSGMSHFGMKELLPSFYNRAGKVGYAPENKAKRCENFLSKLTFNYKGEMILCCSDWESEVVFGNIMENPLSFILANKKYREYYYAHREGKAKDLPLCEKCNLI